MERRDLRALVTAVGIVLLLWSILSGVGTLYVRATEDRSWAEGRCHHASPPNGVNSAEWQGCIRIELAKNPAEIVWPQILGVAAGVGSVSLARQIRVERPVRPS